MKTLYFSVLDEFFIKISSDAEFIFTDTEFLLLQGYVPAISWLKEAPEKIDFTIEHQEISNKKFVQEDSRLIINDEWQGKFSTDLYHLLYGITRLWLLKKKEFAVHGACLGKDDSYTLVLGHSGNGKTSIVLKSLLDDKVKIFSGNKTVISFSPGSIIGIAGTKTITIRGEDKDKLNDSGVKNFVEYFGRHAFNLEKDKYSHLKTVPIKTIAIVKLNDYQEEFKELNTLSALHTVYPYFLDAVNADIVLSGAESVFLGTPPAGVQNFLVSQLKNVLEHIPVYSIIGSAPFVTDKILKL